MANSNGWGDGSVNNNIGWGQGANNNIGWGKSHLNSWSGATDIDGGNPPVNSVAPALSGTAQEGQTLTCSTGTWSGSPTYTYQWKRDGNNITSATNSTYTLVTADVGTSIKCTVTATNFTGSATADSNTVTPTSSVDPDAQAFITAASITDPTQQSAINTLVVDLKGYGVWAKMNAIYPFVGGTATTHKFNLRNPLDTNAAHRILWSGGVTHSANGVQFDGVNGYGNTNLTADFMPQNSSHLSFYSRTNNTTGGIDMGQNDAAGISYSYLVFYSTGLLKAAITINNIALNYLAETTFTNTLGLMIGSRTTSTMLKLFRNTTKTESNSINSTPPQAVNIFIGARNNGGIAASYINKQCAFASIGTGLNDTEAANLYTAVQAFQTTLGRQV